MCEKLFNHVGEFRVHATEHAKRIIDSMHDPLLEKREKSEERNQSIIQSGNQGRGRGLLPVPAESLTDDHRIFLDEEDRAASASSTPFGGG